MYLGGIGARPATKEKSYMASTIEEITIDYFEENESAYIVMEFLDGETVKARLRREGKIPPGEAMQILVEVLKGLSKVHAKGMLHRDIAPDNISLLKDGRVKIFDFGSARRVQNNGSRSLSIEIKRGYSPIEQYRKSKDQGTWTDVYAAAATFYHMVTGKIPQDSLARRDHDKLKPPSKMGVRLPKHVQNAVMNALCVEPEHRTKTAEEFLKEIENELTQRKKVETLKKDIGSLPLIVKIVVPLVAAALIIFAVLLGKGQVRGEDPARVRCARAAAVLDVRDLPEGRGVDFEA